MMQQPNSRSQVWQPSICSHSCKTSTEAGNWCILMMGNYFTPLGRGVCSYTTETGHYHGHAQRNSDDGFIFRVSFPGQLYSDQGWQVELELVTKQCKLLPLTTPNLVYIAVQLDNAQHVHNYPSTHPMRAMALHPLCLVCNVHACVHATTRYIYILFYLNICPPTANIYTPGYYLQCRYCAQIQFEYVRVLCRHPAWIMPI